MLHEETVDLEAVADPPDAAVDEEADGDLGDRLSRAGGRSIEGSKFDVGDVYHAVYLIHHRFERIRVVLRGLQELDRLVFGPLAIIGYLEPFCQCFVDLVLRVNLLRRLLTLLSVRSLLGTSSLRARCLAMR